MLEQALRGTPHIAVLHGLELRQQRAFFHQLFGAGNAALNGAVVEQHIGVLGTGVKIFQRKIDGGQIVAVVR